jgi:arylformamidase
LRIYDISVPIRAGMAVWPGDPAPERKQLYAIAQGAGANVSVVTLSAHTGTHVDAPFHFLPDGGTAEGLPVEAMAGPAQVVEIPGEGHVTAAKLEAAGLRRETTRVLLKTWNTAARLMHDAVFHREFAAITADGAEWLIARGIRLVGVDYLSVEPFGAPGHPTHTALLQAGVVPLEGCDLTGVPPGDYTLVCAPMKLTGSDGAPARVYLLG